MRLRVSSPTDPSRLNARLTVITDTPVPRAKSFIVGVRPIGIPRILTIPYGPTAGPLATDPPAPEPAGTRRRTHKI